MSDTQTLAGRICGGNFGKSAEGRWFIEVEVRERPKCVQIGAPATITLLTSEMPRPIAKAEGRSS